MDGHEQLELNHGPHGGTLRSHLTLRSGCVFVQGELDNRVSGF